MDARLRDDILTRLTRDYNLRPTSGDSNWLRRGICPACGKPELYVNAQSPWVITCGREVKCGQSWHVRELYPDLFEDWTQRAPATKADPTAPAKAYLSQARGFNLAILANTWVQETYWNFELGQGSTTVRFKLANGIWWERLIDHPARFGKMKARFTPGKSTKGLVWHLPIQNWSAVDTIWLVEGIFDAIALAHHGITAVSLMSCNNFPFQWLEQLRMRYSEATKPKPTLVWALDADASRYTEKWARQAQQLGFGSLAAVPPVIGQRKTDWNDLHLRLIGQPADIAEASFTKELAQSLYRGSLLLAETPAKKAALMFRHSPQQLEFPFVFHNRLYWWKLDAEQMSRNTGIEQQQLDTFDDALDVTELQQYAKVTQIANCYPHALYFQREPHTQETWYYYQIDFPHDGAPVQTTLTGAQLAAAPEFKKRVLSAASGALFTGSSKQLDRLIEQQLFALRTVDTVDFLGYSREHQAYLLGDYAVHQGQLIHVNPEDYFEIGRERIKTTQKSVRLTLNTKGDDYVDNWLGDLWRCFGTHGVIALTFWFGSLFAEQIRSRYKSYPFLELTGEAGAGKSTLIQFLWKLFGRDYEGFDPSKSSPAGRARHMGQIASMPIVLIEGDRNEPDRNHARAFDWDELKDFFGGGTLRTRGVKTAGNETYEPPFRGTICISQNAPVNASEAILTRIIKMHFTRPNVTQDSRASADRLNLLDVEQLSYFLLKACRAEKQVMECLKERLAIYEAKLRDSGTIRIERIIKNHAQLMALVDALTLVVDLPAQQHQQTLQAIEDAAQDRQQAISADHPLVAEFWEVYDYLSTLGPTLQLNHSGDSHVIAINLNHFYELAADHRQNLPELKLLRTLLKDSRSHPFVEANRSVYSAIRSRTVKCWIFRR
ncbi:toprim domain-containing protein [Celerinatantimonas sp. MCCC 1A17872]|uniref:toprim domain-containing protein n=1 Tax=Celerinatantimonas sp. MCCC 1A17872 TaxID=3177514 RepID=UPI0038CC162A